MKRSEIQTVTLDSFKISAHQRFVVKGLQDRPFRDTNIVFPYVVYSSYGAEKMVSFIVPQATLGRQHKLMTKFEYPRQ